MDTGKRLLLAAICAVAVASIYTAQTILRQMGYDLGVSIKFTGSFVAASQFGYLIGLVCIVPLGDMLDRPRLIAFNLTMIALGMLFIVLAPIALIAFIGLAVTGVFAVVIQITVAYAASISPEAERGRNIGVVTSGVVVGILGSRVVAGILAEKWGWRSAYFLLIVLSFVLAFLSFLVLLPDQRSTPSIGYSKAILSLGGLFKKRIFIVHGLIAFFVFASFGTLWSGLSLPLALDPWHLSEGQIGLFGIVGIAGALGAVRAGRWADSGRATLSTGLALMILICSWIAIAQLTQSLVLLTIGIVLLDFAVQVVHVSNQHTLMKTYLDRLSTIIGSYMVFYSLGSGLGAVCTTAIFHAYGWIGSSLLGAGFAVCGLSIWGIWTISERADLKN